MNNEKRKPLSHIPPPDVHNKEVFGIAVKDYERYERDVRRCIVKNNVIRLINEDRDGEGGLL